MDGEHRPGEPRKHVVRQGFAYDNQSMFDGMICVTVGAYA